ncbi:hypothetical protein WJX72_004101 [[Myrmecia] bisecta]|uniref:Uncharacterized protein n=1 Tax=[Myrmecia] bisecta TaxID=41462 RepID=A0AAW1Q071_9CHLO
MHWRAKDTQPWTGLKKAPGKFQPPASSDPASGLPISLRNGRATVKTKTLPKGMPKSDVTLDIALSLFRYPRDLGDHDGAPISVRLGPFGFFVERRCVMASVPKVVLRIQPI